MKQDFERFAKYGIVGIVNTLLTYFVFIALRHINVQLDIANASGYTAGMVNSFLWNRRWVFRAAHKKWQRQAVSFLLGAGICWLVQWAAFHALLTLMPEKAAYLLGMAVYTLANFIYNKSVTFR